MCSGVVGKSNLGQVAGPVPLLGAGQGAKEVVQGTVKPLTLAISGRVVWGGVAFLNTIHMAELLDEVAFKVPALVRVKATRHTKPTEPLVNQHPGHCGCSLIVSWNGLGVLWRIRLP